MLARIRLGKGAFFVRLQRNPSKENGDRKKTLEPILRVTKAFNRRHLANAAEWVGVCGSNNGSSF